MSLKVLNVDSLKRGREFHTVVLQKEKDGTEILGQGEDQKD